jgi:conjugative transfer signal peptidase TraF
MTHRWPLLTLCAGAAFALAAAAARHGAAPLVINESPSLPRGLYRLSARPIAVGAIVVVTPPDPARRYLAGLGAGPDARLLKRVAAEGGANACADLGRMSWPGGAAARLARDRRGRPLAAWTGCRRLAGDDLLLVGDTPTSFDSRYFGPVKRSAIAGVYREVWRW